MQAVERTFPEVVVCRDSSDTNYESFVAVVAGMVSVGAVDAQNVEWTWPSTTAGASQVGLPASEILGKR